jgi:OMF family outer membrane factor
MLGMVARAESQAPASAPSEQAKGAGSDAAAEKAGLPLAPAVKGQRPRVNPTLVPPAAKEPAAGLQDLRAPAPLALPIRASQVDVQELRPLSLSEAETLAEINNPELKASASQVDQAQSALRAEIASWYPNLILESRALPSFTTGHTRSKLQNPNQFDPDPSVIRNSSLDRWAMGVSLTAQWDLINPGRVPAIAAARDTFESRKLAYVIALRDLRLQVALAYFELQQADDGVRIGQESVRASLVSLRDARARFQAGVATKLEVLEAETQLARDQQLLAEYQARQSIARRSLAALLDLPQNVTPTAKDPSRALGIWQASLSESVVAAYAFREELDQVLLNISKSNSDANSALATSQPLLRMFSSFALDSSRDLSPSGTETDFTTSYGTAVGLNLSWRLFDGGQSRALYRQGKQAAEENTFRFAQRRDQIRLEVEQSYYQLEKNNRNIITTSREVMSARESLRLARLRFQAGVTTQREVVDNQRDLTRAEVSYSNAIADYNKGLAELRRRTGLDQVMACAPLALPANKPAEPSSVPVEPTPLVPACQAAPTGAV